MSSEGVDGVRRGRVLAVLCSDLHLSHCGPTGRAERDWYGVMGGVLSQLRRMVEEYRCVLLCAGDLFHGWRSTAELINWAAEVLPRPLYAVAGQHDLPYHRWGDLRKSAYWTLKLIGVLTDCSGGPKWIEVEGGGGFWLWGYPWGWELDRPGGSTLAGEVSDGLRVALIHRYVWAGGKGYIGADRRDHVSRWSDWAKRFDVVVSGDNHSNWRADLGKTVWWNCGALIRRTLLERESGMPKVGLLTDQGEVIGVELDLDEEWVSDTVVWEERLGRSDELTGLIEDLTGCWSEGVDVLEMLRQSLRADGLSEGAKRLLSEVVERVHLRRNET